MTINQFPWREDKSNQSLKYKRNKVRLQLAPLLEELMNTDDHNNDDSGDDEINIVGDDRDSKSSIKGSNNVNDNTFNSMNTSMSNNSINSSDSCIKTSEIDLSLDISRNDETHVDNKIDQLNVNKPLHRLKKRLFQLTDQSKELRSWIENEATNIINTCVQYKMNKMLNNKIVYTAVITDIIYDNRKKSNKINTNNVMSKHGNISNLVKSEIFTRVCKQLNHLSLNETFSNKSNSYQILDSNNGSNNISYDLYEEVSDFFIPYEQFTRLNQLCATDLPFGKNKKSLQLKKNVVVTRIGLIIEITLSVDTPVI
jgi:predicted nucleotidyltransferase